MPLAYNIIANVGSSLFPDSRKYINGFFHSPNNILCCYFFYGKGEAYFFDIALRSSTSVVHTSARAQGPPPRRINNSTLFLPVAYNLSYFPHLYLTVYPDTFFF